jgi:hypothetical protein
MDRKKDPARFRRNGRGGNRSYFAGAWYIGAGAGALGQQDAAKKAATVATMASLIMFMICVLYFGLVVSQAFCRGDGLHANGTLIGCKAK